VAAFLAWQAEKRPRRVHGSRAAGLNWSGLPVVDVRPTVFLQHPFFSEWAAESIARDSTIRLPFGTGRTAPIDARDVAEVIAAILVSPTTHIGKVYELTGPRSQNMHGVAAEYSEALGRPITYVDVPFDQWRDQVVRTHNLSNHVSEHFLTMARLHAARALPEKNESGGIPLRARIGFKNRTGRQASMRWGSRIQRIYVSG
jgi:NAD(P)H dehydrogenase (quinone)